MKIKIESIRNPIERLRALKVESGGIAIMSKKMHLNFITIKELPIAAANILKQDALSIGAEFALPKHAVTCDVPKVEGILIASDKHLKLLCQKERHQPFGLKRVALELEEYMKRREREFPLKMMGIINANENSFFEGSRFLGDAALQKVESLIEEGADIIDIGGTSSAPGSPLSSADEELERVRPIIDASFQSGYHKEVAFSIDTYHPKVAEYAMAHGFTYINDITGLESQEMCAVAKEHGAKTIIMHMQGTPTEMQNRPKYEDVVLDIERFFLERIERARKYAIEEIILDVGIGFGKTLEHNCELIRNLSHFKKLGFELLIGASRKSMIDKITPASVSKRLPGTIAIHLESIRNGATIIRTHDIKEHIQAYKVWQQLQ